MFISRSSVSLFMSYTIYSGMGLQQLDKFASSSSSMERILPFIFKLTSLIVTSDRCKAWDCEVRAHHSERTYSNCPSSLSLEATSSYLFSTELTTVLRASIEPTRYNPWRYDCKHGYIHLSGHVLPSCLELRYVQWTSVAHLRWHQEAFSRQVCLQI